MTFFRARSWLISLRDATVRQLGREIADQTERIHELTQLASAAEQSRDRHKESLETTIRLLDAILTGIDFPVDSIDESWKGTPATARAAVGSHVDHLKAAETRRAADAESTADDLRTEIRDLQRKFDVEKKAHEETRAEKRCTDAENRLLSKIHEVDIARRDAERAVHIRRQVEAEAAADAMKADDRE